MWIHISDAYRVSGFLFGFVFNKMFGPRNSVTWSSIAESLPPKCPWSESLDKGSCPAGPLKLQSALLAWTQPAWGIRYSGDSLLQLLGIYVPEE